MHFAAILKTIIIQTFYLSKTDTVFFDSIWIQISNKKKESIYRNETRSQLDKAKNSCGLNID